MSALPCILPLAQAVAQTPRPPSTPLGGFAFYRGKTRALLVRYFNTSMELGRAPCILGRTVWRSRVSRRRRHSLEDMLIFVLDIERCLRRLDPFSQSVIAHMVLEDYTPTQTAFLLHQNRRAIHRAYAAAMDTLTALLLKNSLLPDFPEKLSRGSEEIQSNEPTKQTTYNDKILSNSVSLSLPI
jgi:hypothetical protein